MYVLVYVYDCQVINSSKTYPFVIHISFPGYQIDWNSGRYGNEVCTNKHRKWETNYKWILSEKVSSSFKIADFIKLSRTSKSISSLDTIEHTQIWFFFMKAFLTKCIPFWFIRQCLSIDRASSLIQLK